MDTLQLSERELNALPEYSTSLPTGTTEGKRWKRALWPGEPSLGWVVGEYAMLPNTPLGKISIIWYKVEITQKDTRRQLPLIKRIEEDLHHVTRSHVNSLGELKMKRDDREDLANDLVDVLNLLQGKPE